MLKYVLLPSSDFYVLDCVLMFIISMPDAFNTLVKEN